MKISQNISATGVPTRPERVLSDRKAQVLREITGHEEEQIPCPGGCGGTARMEPPITMTREGEVRTFRVAECQGKCAAEPVKSASGRVRLRAARFEIPCADADDRPAVSHKAEPLAPVECVALVDESGSETLAPTSDPALESAADLPELLARACKRSGLNQQGTAAAVGCSQSAVSKMLRSITVSEATLTKARNWAQSVLTGEWPAPKVADTVAACPPARLSPDQPAKPRASTLSELRPGLTPGGNPYEVVLRSLLEQSAQLHLEQIAGEAAKGFRVRVSLEWDGRLQT